MNLLVNKMIEQIINSYYANLGALNLEGWLKTLADEAILCDPIGKPPVKAHEDGEKFFDLLAKFYETFEINVDNIFVVGQEAAAKWTMKVIAKNGREAMVEGIGVFTLNLEGKIEQMQSYWDEAQMKAKLFS